MFGFLARECGWSFEYIKNNLTISQVKRYYEVLYKLKMSDHAKMVEGVMMAVATAYGSLKQDKFNEYLNVHNSREEIKDTDKTLEQMKQEGLPVEDT